jgi:hypothetical protein
LMRHIVFKPGHGPNTAAFPIDIEPLDIVAHWSVPQQRIAQTQRSFS